MTEDRVIESGSRPPATAVSIQQDLVDIGVKAGQTLLVHSSLSSIGWVSDGPVAVIQALQLALGPDGTLVMPTHTSQLSDPLFMKGAAIPPERINTIRQTLPAFDPLLTATRGMGVIPETFRSYPGVLRSNHPHDSFAAQGPNAKRIVSQHSLHDGLGDNSPLAALYELDASVLLLGVGHDVSTSLHLAENRATYPGKRFVDNGGPVLVDGKRQWMTVRHLDYQLGDFNRLGLDYATETAAVNYGYIGRGQSMLLQMRHMVDYAVRWMEQNRS